jgi:hypothetical protein
VVSLGHFRHGAEVTDHLRQLLQEAEAGKLTGLMAVVQYVDRELGYVGSGSLCESPANGVFALKTMINKLLTG